MLLFAGWQSLTVHVNYQGNWTALFCTGGDLPIPPSLLPGTYVFPHSLGYDGQMYRYVAHDPFFNGEDHRYLDDAVLRGRRVLVPGLAWALAFGRQDWIDAAYIVVIWLFVFLGCYWCGLVFLLLPATLISMDRLTIDIATCAITAGFVRYWVARANGKLYAVAALACLSRETGAFLLLGLLIESLVRKQWRRAALFSTAALPAAAWYVFLWLYGPPPSTSTGLPDWLMHAFEFGPLLRMLHPVSYPFSPALTHLAQSVDAVSLAGMIAGFALAIWFAIRKWREAPAIAAGLFAASFVAVSGAGFWDTVYGYARPFHPCCCSRLCETINVC